VNSFFSEKNITDLIFFGFELPSDAIFGGMAHITVEELYKRRKEPFPSTISLKEDHLISFDDSKYFLSVYPTKS
jgi:hypothetical protein